MFAAWGRFVFRRKWWVLATSLLLLGAIAGSGFSLKGELTNSSRVHVESQRAADLMTAQLPKATNAGGSTFEILFSSKSLRVTDAAYRAAVDQTLAPLRADSRIREVQTTYSVPPAEAGGLVSRNGDKTLAVVTVRDGEI